MARLGRAGASLAKVLKGSYVINDEIGHGSGIESTEGRVNMRVSKFVWIIVVTKFTGHRRLGREEARLTRLSPDLYKASANAGTKKNQTSKNIRSELSTQLAGSL
jgi:hypothetical protein